MPILIEKPDYRRYCNVCFSQDGVKEIEFRANNCGTVVALCKKCMKELKEELERHGDLK